MNSLLVADAEGRIEMANRCAEQQFGYEASELVGQPLTQVLFSLVCDTIAMVGTGGSHNVGRRKDGSGFLASIQVRRLEPPTGVHVVLAIALAKEPV